MNFNVYSGKDIQNFLSMLNQCESAGLTDIRFVRERLQSDLAERFKPTRIQKRSHARLEREFKRANRPKCPSCGSSNWYVNKRLDGVVYNGCGDCYFSQMVNVND